MHQLHSKLILRSVFVGFLVSTFIMGSMVIAAIAGVFSATQALVTLSQPHANPLSMLVAAAIPGVEGSPEISVAVALVCAWVQFGLAASVVAAVVLYFLARVQR